MKKVICECGSSKWILKESLVYTCIPPIHADIYECVECGKTYEKTTQSSLEEYYPEIEIFDNELLTETDINKITWEHNQHLTGTQSTVTFIDGVRTLAEPSKVRYE